MNEDSQLNAVALEVSSGITNISVTLPKPVVAVAFVRDKRTMNHMDSESKAAHIRLEQWGRETRDSLNGYPPVTLLGRLIEQGPTGAGQTGRPPVALSELSAHADSCVAKLCQIDQRVLRYYYQHDEPMEALARKMSMRVRQAQNVLKRARWRFMAHLAVMEG
jgi:hypothetical protein